MPANASLSDDYVAEILKRDAERKDSNRFVASGLGSLLAGRSRPRSEAPKPNARFLKNLVRDVDSHNAALKEKEERDSRRRMWDLQRDKQKKKSGSRSPTSEPRPRHGDRDTKHRHRSRSRDRNPERESKRRRRSLERYAPGSSRHKRARSRSRSRSPDHKSKHRHRHRNRSPESRTIPKQKFLSRSEPETTSPPRNPASLKASANSDSDSDPLESIIGPKPPPSKSNARGRGAQNHSSTMDDHFKTSYNPQTDVHLDAEDDDRDDWDMALEALRDRAKWKQSGAERLRAAGFTEEEVSNWQSGTASRDGGEKDVRDVKWKKKGEGREWDRGKVLEGDYVGQKAEWGRLKDP